MSIDKRIQRGDKEQRFVCDSCKSATTQWYPAEDFTTLVSESKTLGWYITKDKYGFSHTCPECSGWD